MGTSSRGQQAPGSTKGPQKAGRHTGIPRFLVSAPGFYDSHFLFNPWMQRTERVDRRRARQQWQRFVQVLEEAGAEIDTLEPSGQSAAQCFTADVAVVVSPGRALLLRNDGPRGHVEPREARRWFEEHDFTVEVMPPAYRLDGGNLLRLHDGSYLVGLKPGSSGRSERYFAGLALRLGGVRTHPVGLLLDRYLHIDMAIGRLGDSGYVVYEEALFGGGETLGGTPVGDRPAIPVSASDAESFACNMVTVGDVIVTGDISRELKRQIASLGFWVERLPLTEFYKAGGGAKCLTLQLTAEERRAA